MTSQDPQTCRRALREIGEIAAVAALADSQMTDQEALQTIAAISGWVREEAPDGGIACGGVVKRIHQLTASTDFETLDDQAAVALFSEVMKVLEAPSASAFGDGAVSPP